MTGSVRLGWPGGRLGRAVHGRLTLLRWRASRRRPRVLFVVHDFLPRIGGSPLHTQWISAGLTERGCAVLVLSPRAAGEPFTVAGTPICDRWSSLIAADVVFTYSVSDLTASAARRLGSLRHPPVWLHHPCAVDSPISAAMMRRADRVVCFNPEDRRLAEATREDRTAIVDVPVGADPARRGATADGDAFRRCIGADYVLWVGAWLAAKGVRNLCERFARLKAAHPRRPLKLVMFGGYGDEEFPVDRPDIVAISGDMADVPAALAGCLFVAYNSPPHPIGYDANPLILLEAMINGKTFLAQRGTPLLEMIADLGLVVDEDDEWLDAAERLLTDEPFRRALERKSAAAGRHDFTMEAMNDALADLVRHALPRGEGIRR